MSIPDERLLEISEQQHGLVTRCQVRYLATLAEGRGADQYALSAAILATRDQHVASWSGARGPSSLAEFDADVAACAQVDTSRFVLRGTDDGTSVILRAAQGPQVR